MVHVTTIFTKFTNLISCQIMANYVLIKQRITGNHMWLKAHRNRVKVVSFIYRDVQHFGRQRTDDDLERKHRDL